jgi:hypothetical protein
LRVLSRQFFSPLLVRCQKFVDLLHVLDFIVL